MARADWGGIFPVLVTPFGADGSINEIRYKALIDDAIANGAQGVVAAGSTGEFYALTKAERARLFKLAVDHAARRVPVLAGVADLRVEDVLEACQSAVAAGCAGGLILPPIYAMPSPREVVAFFAHISRNTPLPLMLYNSPRRAKIELTPALVEQLSALRTVVAIKDSSGDITQVSELVQRVGDNLRVFVGYETMIVPARAVGAHGVIAMAHQIAGPLIRAYWDKALSGDKALEDLGRDVCALYRCFQSGSYYAAIKETMSQLGRDAGGPRLPLLPLADEQKAAIAKIIADAGLARWAKA
ncbi:dihydrodipicolinate synthase family protein [Methylobacterium nodulans]|uniref:Dihydrodipicolinate synthetase n=1 Tax=Methylobacterium nodulans (strain LMG 21967 / CNCM I-2342 / ORS 2060) TaxID=460265 RepID=B8IIJ4_METNO|nr:dihydrodipicolinate synthase family protein [Methylobacterium nodulans]ACL58920.1 dihydrodipicolinate synthetase [Methylobacterium nodulans ORS 2060]ACL59871.1 dihydrodipicolinate synthetase [Methylobacterium nodulans ORS 2060]